MENIITSSLCHAAHVGLYDVMQRLLQSGHNVNLADNRGWTALHEAVSNGHDECIILLLNQEGCTPNFRTHEGWTPMYLACRDQNKPSLVKLLAEHGASSNIGDNEDITPLHLAAKKKNLELVCELLNLGANIHKRDFNGFTPLSEAISQHALEVVKHLLEKGALPDHYDTYGRTSLFLAASDGWVEGAQVLLEYGASVNASEESGTTPLMVAATSGSLPMVHLLLEKGADPNVECCSHQLALNLAVHTGQPKLAELLLEKTDKNVIIANSKWSPEEMTSLPALAIDSLSADCLAVVLKSEVGPIVNSTPLAVESIVCSKAGLPYKKMSPLCFLLQTHFNMADVTPMMECLLDAGALVNAETITDMPPLVALTLAEPENADDENFMSRKLHFFRRLLEHGCNVDYCSSSESIPDAILAGCVFNSSELNQPLLSLLLQSCVHCNSDNVLSWLIGQKLHFPYWVARALLDLGTISRFQLDNILDTLQKYIKPSEKNKITIESRPVICSLQDLGRTAVRHYLWSKSGSSMGVKKILDAQQVPICVQQCIIGVALCNLPR